MAKPIKTLELHYQIIQFLIIYNTALLFICYSWDSLGYEWGIYNYYVQYMPNSYPRVTNLAQVLYRRQRELILMHVDDMNKKSLHWREVF